MKKKFLFSLVPLFFSFFFIFFQQKAFAMIFCDGTGCGGGYTYVKSYCDNGIVPPGSVFCDPGIDNQYCGKGDYCPYTYCGWNSNACCSGANYWTKYWQSCVTLSSTDSFGNTVYSCNDIAQSTGQTCSMGDKCAVQPTAILQPGQCDCSVGPFNYKTCCDKNNGVTVNAVCYPSNDGTGHTDGDCPSGSQYATVFCGSGSEPACGQASCDQFAPWQTIKGHIQDTNGTSLANVNVTIHNSSRNITHTFTTGSSGNYQDNATTVRKGDNFSVTPNNTSNARPCNNGYICGNSWAPNSPNPYSESNSSGCSVSSTNTYTCKTMSYTPGQISGTVYIDYNHNQIVDGSDGPSNISLTITDSSGTQTTSNAGNGTFSLTGSGMSQGSHTVTATIGTPGWSIENPTQTVSIGQNVTNMIFYITPTYTISGVVYNDVNKNGYYNPPSSPPPGNPAGNDSPYGGTGTIKLTGPTTTTLTFSGGNYSSGQILYAGTYTVSYQNVPTSYQSTYPLNGPPPSLQVTVGVAASGTSCTTNGAHDAYCDGNGNVLYADFGITNEFSWVQGVCSDLRVDTGFSDPIPLSANCGGTSGPYADICSNGTVGIISTGSTDANFQLGSASTNNWVAGGSSYPESFTPVNASIIRSSYDYVTASLRQAGITATDLSTYCTLSSCSLPNTLPSGVYNANGNLNLVGTPVYVEAANKYIVLLVNGTTTINGNINIPVNSGSSFTLISKGNITIPATVGESSVTSLASDLDGFYSTDQSFIIQSASGGTCNLNGTSNDLKLNIGGAVVVNAGEQGGSFQNFRDLCINDTDCPTVTVSQRTDLLLDAPNILKHVNNFFQEMTP